VTSLAEQLTAQRAEERIGEVVEVLIESTDGEGRAAHQAPDVDGTTLVNGDVRVGDIVRAVVVGTEGVDLIADLIEVVAPPAPVAVPA
jgi:tRNA A37 methylthiotransferase MiaB